MCLRLNSDIGFLWARLDRAHIPVLEGYLTQSVSLDRCGRFLCVFYIWMGVVAACWRGVWTLGVRHLWNEEGVCRRVKEESSGRKCEGMREIGRCIIEFGTLKLKNIIKYSIYYYCPN